MPLAAAAPASPWYEIGRLGLFFLKIGATLFGSGYVLVSYLQSGLVDRPGPWLTQQQLLDAIAVGQVTPGPLLTTATFVGYVRGFGVFGGSVAGGVLGGVVATVAIFFPSFVLVAAFGRVLPRIRANRHARAALDSINAAVAAMVLSVAARLAWGLQSHGHPDRLRVALAVASLAALLRWNVNSTWLILTAAVVGWAGQAAGVG
jgi:chromate transporter